MRTSYISESTSYKHLFGILGESGFLLAWTTRA